MFSIKPLVFQERIDNFSLRVMFEIFVHEGVFLIQSLRYEAFTAGFFFSRSNVDEVLLVMMYHVRAQMKNVSICL